MNINKKLDRVKQWAGEKMGAESKTGVSDEFKALEMEMTLRHEGMDRLHKSMTSYVKSMSKRNEAEDKEKVLPVAYLGQTMMTHGEDFEPNSEFGNCLIGMGRVNEKIGRIQESYTGKATITWLESLERSLAQMKEYQASRKKLESRRLAYDASLTKLQKSKREDYRVEEEVRSQKAKYEESSEDVQRRMEDIKEAEADSVADIGSFLDAELEYYERCRDELLKLKREWPAGQTPAGQRDQRSNGRKARSRSNTAHSYSERYDEVEPEPVPVRPSIRSAGRVLSSARLNTHPESPDSPDSPYRAATWSRSQTFDGPASMIHRETATPALSRKVSIPSDMGHLRTQLRPTTKRINTTANMTSDVFGDPSDDSTANSNSNGNSPDHHSWRDRSVSPATSHGSVASRSASYGNGYGGAVGNGNGKKGPPPPPPSRSKKPPPPLPMKRSEFGAVSVARY